MYSVDFINLLTQSLFFFTSFDMKKTKSRFNLKDIEKKIIKDCLAYNAGNVIHSSEDLGICRVTLYKKVDQYGLNLARYR